MCVYSNLIQEYKDTPPMTILVPNNDNNCNIEFCARGFQNSSSMYKQVCVVTAIAINFNDKSILFNNSESILFLSILFIKMNADIITNIIRVAHVDWLWSEYCLLTESAFYSELRNPYIVSLLCKQWGLLLEKLISRFFLQFDRKYFLTDYTTYEYRKDRVSRGFGATRLFKYAFLRGKDTMIREYEWLNKYLAKYCFEKPDHIKNVGGFMYYKIIERGFRKNVSDEKILDIYNKLRETHLYDELERTITAFAVVYKRPNLLVSGFVDYQLLARILDDPKYIEKTEAYCFNFTECPNLIRYFGFDKIPSYVICTRELCDYFREVEMYPSNICSSSVLGLKMLIEKGMDIDYNSVNIVGALWLYKTGYISIEKLRSLLELTIKVLDPDSLLEASLYKETSLTAKVKSVIDRLIK